MVDERELMFSIVKKQKDCEFSLRFLLQRGNEAWSNFFTMLKLVKKGARSGVCLDYGDFVLGEKLLSIEEGLSAMSDIFPGSDGSGKLVVPGYDGFPIEGGGQPTFVPSSYRHGWIRSDYPARFCSFRVHHERISKLWAPELLKAGFPYYPNLSEATISFFELPIENFNNCGEVYLVVVDYRARIESLKLSFSDIETRLHCPEVKSEDLVLKVFAKSDSRRISLPDIIPSSESVKFGIGFQPDFMSVALVSREDGMKIDAKEFAKWMGENEGIFVERPEEEIFALTRIGEGQDLEYKYDVQDANQKNELVESIVAFSNSNRGIILIGVDDHGEIVESHANTEDLQRTIHDSCDPPPRDVKIEEKKIGGKRIVVVEVPEGDDKPYQSKRDKNWYVRHNADDMRMERSELLHFLEERKRSNPYDTLARW
jgi:hypothetical protein